MMAALTCSGVQVGWACRTSATMPATCGVDMDVPDSRAPSVPVPTAADRTDRPGAATSGLRLPSAAGPPDEKSAADRYAGFTSVVTPVTVIVVPAAAWRSAAAEGLTPRKGMVTSVIGPSSGG